MNFDVTIILCSQFG